jgi:hypothetical protein
MQCLRPKCVKRKIEGKEEEGNREKKAGSNDGQTSA